MNSTAPETNMAERILSENFAQVFRAYIEASDEAQTVIRDMCELINCPETDPDDREAAVVTLMEALFPTSYDGELGIDMGDLRELLNTSSEFKDDIRELDERDRQFAERLKNTMNEKGMTQTQLASLIGVTQPAISMMLNRKCHPQRATVKKLADALGVMPSALWPNRS
ncbi:MAG: helix-turn-helix transcriptional regulator [Planctomycetota bacterium]